MGNALGQLGDFKADVDTQTLVAQGVAANGKHYIPVTMFATIKLGVDGVPIFSTDTLGQLVINGTIAPWTVWFRYSVSGNNTTVPEASCFQCGGAVILTVFNRYYPQQSIAYENGALIRSQPDGQVIKAPPAFDVVTTGSNVTVDFSLFQLFGSGGLMGSETEGLQSQVIGVDFESYTRITTDIYINHTTSYGPAWYSLFNATLGSPSGYNILSTWYNTRAGFTYQQQYDASGRALLLKADNPVFTVQSQWNTVTSQYSVTVRLKTPGVRNGMTVPPVSPFNLLHSYVNVAAGTQGNTVGI